MPTWLRLILTCQFYIYKGRCQWRVFVEYSQYIKYWGYTLSFSGIQNVLKFAFIFTRLYATCECKPFPINTLVKRIWPLELNKWRFKSWLSYLLWVTFVKSLNQHETLFPFLTYIMRTINTFLVVVRFRDNVYKVPYIGPDLYRNLTDYNT